MDCDCKVESACTATSTYCQDGGTEFDDTWSGLWLDFNSLLTGSLTIVGFLLYRFSQGLPAMIRWPIRLICSLTGLSSMWGWLSHLVRVLHALFVKVSWLSVMFKSIARSFTSAKQCVTFVKKLKEQIKSSKDQPHGTEWQSLSNSSPGTTPTDPSLRLILLGPSSGGRTTLADTLLGSSVSQSREDMDPSLESTSRRAVVDNREVTVVDTPDLLGSSIDVSKRAREVLRSLQLASPGPHAILLVIRAPGSSDMIDQDAAKAIRATLKILSDPATGHIIIVLTHMDCLAPECTLGQLLEVDAGGLRTSLSICGQRMELVNNSPDCPPEARRDTRRRLLERVAEMRELRGHFTHELQRKDDQIREELLADMTSLLALKLGHM
ncbi:uncharacterized protein FYW47_014613 [Aplochiton taeniatus]